MLPATLLVVMIVVILITVELLKRSIVRRPQPAVDEDLLGPTMRSGSIHALVGAGIRAPAS
ncbi:MAG: hypothetical protein ACXWXQ_05875 [Actinomycetota bacterium]